jgi:hypothetical protein
MQSIQLSREATSQDYDKEGDDGISLLVWIGNHPTFRGTDTRILWLFCFSARQPKSTTQFFEHVDSCDPVRSDTCMRCLIARQRAYKEYIYRAKSAFLEKRPRIKGKTEK